MNLKTEEMFREEQEGTMTRRFNHRIRPMLDAGISERCINNGLVLRPSEYYDHIGNCLECQGLMHGAHSITECEDRKCRLPEKSASEKSPLPKQGPTEDFHRSLANDVLVGDKDGLFLSHELPSSKEDDQRKPCGKSHSRAKTPEEWRESGCLENRVDFQAGEFSESMDYWIGFRKRVEFQLRQGEDFNDNPVMVRACLHQIHREVEVARRNLKIEW